MINTLPEERARRFGMPANTRRLHRRPGGRRFARRDPPRIAVHRRRRADRQQLRLRLFRAARIAARRTPAPSVGPRPTLVTRCARSRASRASARWSMSSASARWRSSSSPTPPGSCTTPSSSAGDRSRNGVSLAVVGVVSGARPGRAALAARARALPPQRLEGARPAVVVAGLRRLRRRPPAG